MEQSVISVIVSVLLGFKSGTVSNQRRRFRFAGLQKWNSFAGRESGIVDKRHDVGGLESEIVINVVILPGLESGTVSDQRHHFAGRGSGIVGDQRRRFAER